MVTNHYRTMHCSVSWFDIVDDFGNVTSLQGLGSNVWANAYRFANGQTFEQAGMRSIGCLVAEH